jgi:hypothetical protein
MATSIPVISNLIESSSNRQSNLYCFLLAAEAAKKNARKNKRDSSKNNSQVKVDQLMAKRQRLAEYNPKDHGDAKKRRNQRLHFPCPTGKGAKQKKSEHAA